MSNAGLSSCEEEIKKIKLTAFKLITKEGFIIPNSPPIWALVAHIETEEMNREKIMNYLYNKCGLGIYRLYKTDFDEFMINIIAEETKEDPIPNDKSKEEKKKEVKP